MADSNQVLNKVLCPFSHMSDRVNESTGESDLCKILLGTFINPCSMSNMFLILIICRL